MKTYLVGGAVRDEMMGKDSKDKDYVVTGATPEQMLENGFVQVGASFPVFLHPKTGDEYALARKENSTGDGYHDFETDAVGTTLVLEDGTEIKTLDPALMQKFLDAGFNTEDEYSATELYEFFRNIDQ